MNLTCGKCKKPIDMDGAWYMTNRLYYHGTCTATKATRWTAEKTKIDGYTFASGEEARRYRELKIKQEQGYITGLEVHPSWKLVVNGVNIGKYTADYRYMENGAPVVEDVKGGVVSRDYPLRKKLLKALYGIDVVEIRY